MIYNFKAISITKGIFKASEFIETAANDLKDDPMFNRNDDPFEWLQSHYMIEKSHPLNRFMKYRSIKNFILIDFEVCLDWSFRGQADKYRSTPSATGIGCGRVPRDRAGETKRVRNRKENINIKVNWRCMILNNWM